MTQEDRELLHGLWVSEHKPQVQFIPYSMVVLGSIGVACAFFRFCYWLAEVAR